MTQPMKPKQAITVIRSSLIAGPVLFLAAGTFLRWKNPSFGAPGGLKPLVFAAIAIAVAGFLASRAVARLPAPTELPKAVNRMVTQLALCETGALFGGFAWMLTGNPWSLLAPAVAFLGMALVPSPAPTVLSASSRMMR